MSDPFVGQVPLFGFPFAPQGWALCQGQLMPIRQNVALFGVIGTNYGGDGRSSFALPNLQGRAPVGAGQGPGLSAYRPGDSGGAGAVTLQSAAMPLHAHGFVASTDAATATNPQDNVLARAVRSPAPHAVAVEPALAPGAELARPDRSAWRRISTARTRTARRPRLRRAASWRPAKTVRTTTCSLIWR